MGKIEVLNNYLNKYDLTHILALEKALKPLKDIDLSIDMIRFIINNNENLQNGLKSILSQLDNITEVNIVSLTNNEIVNNFLMTYAEDNNMLVNEELKKDISDFILTDNIVSDYINNIKRNYSISSWEEQKEWFHHLENEEEYDIYFNKIFNDYLMFVVNVAYKYMGPGVELIDLIQEGNLGLMKAIKMFDYKKGFHFTTYAYEWIRQYITRFVGNTKRSIRVSINMHELLQKINVTTKMLEDKLERKPTAEELAEELGISKEKVLEALALEPKTQSINEVYEVDDETRNLSEIIADERISVETEAIDNILKEELRNLIDNNLDVRCKIIFLLHYGFIDDTTYAFGDIGNMLGLTRERIRAILVNSLETLKKMQKEEDIEEKNLRETLECSKEDMKYLVDVIDDTTLNLLKSIYGEDLNKKVKREDIPKILLNQYKSYISYSKDIIKEKNANFALKKLLNCNDNLYNIIVEYLKTMPEVYNLLAKVYGEDLDGREDVSALNDYDMGCFYVYLASLSMYIKKVNRMKKNVNYDLEVREESSTDIDYNKLIEYINTPFFQNIIVSCNIPLIELIVLILYYGYINNTKFSSKTIASFLGLKEEKIKEIISTKTLDDLYSAHDVNIFINKPLVLKRHKG